MWNEHGVSSILPLSGRGYEMLHGISDSFVYGEVPLDTAVSQLAVHDSLKFRIDINRGKFETYLSEMNLKKACNIPSIRVNALSAKIKLNLKTTKRKIRYWLNMVIGTKS